MKTLTLELDCLDYQAIADAIAIRGSALYIVDGELLVPDHDGEPRGVLLAEICREWAERISGDVARADDEPAKGA